MLMRITRAINRRRQKSRTDRSVRPAVNRSFDDDHVPRARPGTPVVSVISMSPVLLGPVMNVRLLGRFS